MIYRNNNIKRRTPNVRGSSSASPMRWGLALLLTVAMLFIASSGGSGVPIASADSVEIISVTIGEDAESSKWIPIGPGQTGAGHNERLGERVDGPSEPLLVPTNKRIPVVIEEINDTWKATEWRFFNDLYSEVFTCADTTDYLGNVPSDPYRTGNLEIVVPDTPGEYSLTDMLWVSFLKNME